MLKILISLFISIIAMGCGPRYVDYFPYHEDGRPKPSVAIVPVMTSCEVDVPWDISQELTNNIRYEIMNNGELYLLSQEEVSNKIAQMGGVDFFTKESQFANNFCGTDFIVLIEFMGQRYCDAYSVAGCPVPFSPCREMELKTRIKVVDLRRGARIVQQEIMADRYLVTPEFAGANGRFPNAGPEAYQKSSLGNAYQRMVCNVVAKLERVIKCSY